MPHHALPTPETIAADLSVPERVALFCVATRDGLAHAEVMPATVRTMIINALIERDTGGALSLTDQGRAVFAALVAKAAAPP
jgi:hypothetical protein